MDKEKNFEFFKNLNIRNLTANEKMKIKEARPTPKVEFISKKTKNYLYLTRNITKISFG